MAAPGLPAFPNKLWTLVEDPSTNDLICWNYAGTSFHIYDSARFSKELLPLYFKHNNIASFIRQLNLYGFRKVVKIETGGLKVEKDDMEFSHPCFIRDNENLLENIKRKVSAATLETSGKGDGEPVLRQGEVSKVLNEVVIIKDKQTTMNSELETLKRENETLWGEVTSLRQEHKKQQQIVNKLLAMNSQLENLKRENETLWGEVATLRQKHQKQQQIVHKLIQFLVTMVGNGQGTCGMPNMKRRMPLMINDSLSQPKKARDIEDLATVGQVQSPPATPNTPDSLNNQVSGQSPSGLQIQEITDNIHQASPATVSSPNAESRQNLGTTDENDLLSFIKTPGTQGSSDLLNLDSNSLSNSYNSSLIDNLVDVVKEHLNYMVSDIHNDNASGSQIDNRVTVPSGSTVVTAPSGELGTAGGGTNNSVALTSTPPLFCRSPSQPEVVENIENLHTDIDSLRDRLSAGSYTLDAATLMELINAETPVPPVPDSMKEDTFHFSQLLNSIDNDDSTIPVATENIRQSAKIEQSDLNPRGSIVGNELIQYNPANVDLDACKSKTYTLSVPIGATANDDLSNIGCFDLVLEPTPMSNDDLDLEISSQLNTPIVDRKEPGLLTEEID